MTELSDLCRSCGGRCCTHPWMSDEEYLRLVLLIGNEKAQQGRPARIKNGWVWQLKEGEMCPGHTENGCVLPYAARPACCRIYPFIAMPIITKELKIDILPVLDIHVCPYWMAFGDRFEVVKKEIENAKTED